MRLQEHDWDFGKVQNPKESKRTNSKFEKY